MNLGVHPEADAEFAGVVEWYESRRPGLGDEFEQVIYDAFDIIVESPRAWRRWPELEAVRVFPLERFPYVLPYAIRDTTVVVLAIAHAKRRPGYWRTRNQLGTTQA